MFKKLTLLLLLIVSPCIAAKQLTVVSSIQPIHSLVSYLLQGTSHDNTLLLPPDRCPHTYQLTPKNVQTLSQASLVVWIGPELEFYLQKPITTLSKKARVIECMRMSGLTKLPLTHSHGHNDEHPHHRVAYDPHIWLSLENTRKIAKQVSEELINLDDTNKLKYQVNLSHFLKEIDSLEEQMTMDFSKIKQEPFMVFHDAFAYLTDHFGLKKAYVVTDNPHAPLSIHKMNKAKKTIVDNDIRCLFTEPGSSEKVMQQLADETNIKSGRLDPEGLLLSPGKRAYFELMRSLSHSLRSCLDEDFEQES